ncbi:tripeptidyl peptidase A [Pluteus cervinus]|uniref:Tripeptidyl peptidase A n=1 Tax=Pluteus cervinus TaxID=181527 RepID=A0ACD3ALP3_9AGAR|nr:tripeptidyl peptidase A [Pluteus cervinus]
MGSSFRFLFALFCAVPALSLPASPYEVKESVHPPHGWVQHSAPSPSHGIELRIGLPQPNFGVLETHLYEVSDPDHHRYGQHLSKEEVEELIAPHPDSLDAVNDWLASHGIQEEDVTRSPGKDWVTLKLPVELVEKMLDTKYHVWKHTKTGDYIVRTTSYSLPIHLHEHVDVIQPTTMFGQFKPFRSTISKVEAAPATPAANSLGSLVNPATGLTIDASCNVTITVSCLQQLYNAVGFTPSAKGNSIGITGYLEEFANFADLQQFFAQQVPAAENSSFKVVSVNNGLNNQSDPGFEANLDVQFAFGISHPITPTFFTTGGSPPFIPDDDTPTDTNEPYLNWLDFILSQENIPLSISTSYGDDEQTVPEAFAKRVCADFAQLGARGTSVIFSSGDNGVGDGDSNPATQTCFTNNGRNETKFIPVFPATCPFVTSVGATDNVAPEVAVSSFFSGGGFSNYFSRPPYQDVVVPNYLKTELAPGTFEGLFNPEGRGFPDISAQGDRFEIIVGGQAFLIGGTSASSPTVNGFISLLNDVRLKSGWPALGFLNPFIYKKGFAGFTDILSGHNSGCGTPGFNVTKGWDPVTGFGTPNFGKLKELILEVTGA